MTKKIVLINHLNTLTGAPVYLYNLAIYLKTNGYNVFVLDVNPNDKLQSRYIGKYALQMYYYKGKIEEIEKEITRIKPNVVYVNCPRKFLSHFIELQTKCTVIFHSHETWNNFEKKNWVNKLNNFFVVTNKIQEEYKKNNINVQVARTFIDKNELNNIEKLFNEPVGVIKNSFRQLDRNKIIIGMSGVFTFAKGNDIFIKTAMTYIEYEFIWIGGNLQPNERYNENFFHIEHTANPYKYFKLFDVFYMTSREEADPYVVYEMTLFNIPVIYNKNDIKNLKKYNSKKINKNTIRTEPDETIMKIIKS